jgi:hypothetical protein
VYPALQVQGKSADVTLQDELRLQPIVCTGELSATENSEKPMDCESTIIDPY